MSPGAIGSADIVVNDGTVLQTMAGFGASLTDSSALILNNLKASSSNQNRDNYNNVLNTLFNPGDDSTSAGLTYLRVPLGASDFSANSMYFLPLDMSLTDFNIDSAPAYLFSIIQDIQAVNPQLKVHVLPWSLPGWMKYSKTMNGGSFDSTHASVFANYFLKSLQGFQSKGNNVYAIGIQEAQIGQALRSLMDQNGFSGVRIVAGINDAPSAFAGNAFHCYLGNVGQQDSFHSAHPDKEVFFTGQYGTDWWSDIKWYMDNIIIGATEGLTVTGLMWNLALDGNGGPLLPGADSCTSPASRPLVTVNNDGSFRSQLQPRWSTVYAMAHASKAIIPKDANGPFGKRVGVSVGGDLSGLLRVSADDVGNQTGSWNPTPITTTIEFRGQQATYTFPVGVTTLWWFAPDQSDSRRDGFADVLRTLASANPTGGTAGSVPASVNRRRLRFERNL
ncbi:glycoside hydrolase superfamily [Daedaleopsis nitida]|nr:glycoside hydrolase superfamily [Daedaleopsis nitida]